LSVGARRYYYSVDRRRSSLSRSERPPFLAKLITHFDDAVAKFSKPEFRRKFQREVPLFFVDTSTYVQQSIREDWSKEDSMSKTRSIRQSFTFFLFSTFLFLVPCGGLNFLPSAFERTLKQHLVSYCIISIEHRLVTNTDRDKDRHRATASTRASIVSSTRRDKYYTNSTRLRRGY